MPTLSLCMIVKNEEKVLSRCLNSIKNLFDEIIIVDTGSTDSTKQIALSFTKNVYDFVWNNNFSDARNYAKSFAKCDYVMWLDADDILPKKSLNALKNLKQSLCADTYMLKYDIAFENNKPTFSYFRERIIKNCEKCVWQGVVHECIVPFGKIEKLNISVEHHKIKNSNSNRNLNIYKNLKKTRKLNTREQYYYARELFDHKKYSKCITELNKFLKQDGWIENKIDAYIVLSKCYYVLKNFNKQFECLTKTFMFDAPRASVCCMLGDYFLTKKNIAQAIYWYTLATKCKMNFNGFVEQKYYSYIPNINLCVCYYQLGDINKANYYNEKAGKSFESDIVKQNRLFFQSIKKST